MQLNVLVLFLLYVLMIVNIVSKCSRKKSDYSRKRRERHRDREDVRESTKKEETAYPVQEPTAMQPQPPEPAVAVATAHELDEVSPEELFKCRDYTPAIFNDLQPLFDLLKAPPSLNSFP